MAPKDINRIFTWEVVPADADVDFDDAIKKVQAISIPGCNWIGEPKVSPHVFGLSKITIVSQITVDDEGIAETIEAAIEALSTEEVEYSGSVVNVDFIEVDKPKLSEVDQLKEDLAKTKKLLEQANEDNAALSEQIVKLQNEIVVLKTEGPKAGAGGAKADSGDKIEIPDGVDKKLAAKAQQDGAAKAKELKKMNEEFGNKFFAAGITSAEGNPAALEVAMAGANKSAPDLGKIFASEGPASLAVVAFVPASLADTVNVEEWLAAAMESIGGMAAGVDVTKKGEMISLKVPQDTNAGRFPIKDKDEVIANGFQFIRAKGLLNEDDDDEEPDMSALGEC
jgi:translation elongation factor EF-1beta